MKSKTPLDWWDKWKLRIVTSNKEWCLIPILIIAPLLCHLPSSCKSLWIQSKTTGLLLFLSAYVLFFSYCMVLLKSFLLFLSTTCGTTFIFFFLFWDASTQEFVSLAFFSFAGTIDFIVFVHNVQCSNLYSELPATRTNLLRISPVQNLWNLVWKNVVFFQNEKLVSFEFFSIADPKCAM